MTDQDLLNLADARRQFYRLAAWGVCHGLVTAAEVKTISRPGTRKAGYFGRHLHDLKALLRERYAARQKPAETTETA